MKTLTPPVITQRDAGQSGWCELYEFYLKGAINTPFGSTATLRLCTCPGGIDFFTPKIAPEPAGTQGNAANYAYWPLKRQLVKGSNKFTNDKVVIAASNVTREFAQMLAEVDWEAVPVIIRKISTTLAGAATADDCAIIFSGNVDSVKVTLEQLQFTCSNDFGTFQLMAPRENMHANCRFNWADDQCTMIRFLAGNYKTKTVGSGSTVVNVKCSGLTEDAGARGSYGTDLVDALPNGSITASSEAGLISGATVVFTRTVEPKTGLVNSYFDFTATTAVLANNTAVTFAGATPPTGLMAGTTYYIHDHGFSGYRLSAVLGGAKIAFSDNGSGTITLSTAATFSAYTVKTSLGGYWRMNSAGDWGTNTQGYWQIPDAQAGRVNAALKPWITFDFGVSQSPKLWRVQGINTNDREELPRLILFFSSSDNFASDAVFEMIYEMPPTVGQLYDVLIPNARNVRYWRICVRTRWSDTLRYSLLACVSAFTGSRHYWQDAQITFAASTTTAALRSVTRTVRESYAGELICAALPASPVAGDVFTIERGCSRLFNACAARGNQENFGGFDSMPFETVVR